MERKMFNLTSFKSSDNSGEGKMIAQLKEKFQVTGKKSEKFQLLIFFHKAHQLGKSKSSS
jgi:hypothetical protein